MKVLLVATVQSHICQFHKPLVKVLHEAGAEVHIAARNNLAEKNGLTLDFADNVFDVPFSRSPKSSDNIKAYKELKKIINEGNYAVVHCNTPMGGIVARLAARKARKNGTKVFYTAHGFHFYKGASKKAWAVFYPIEKFFAEHFTDKLITITNEDYELAKSKFKTNVYHIHGVGVNSQKYRPVTNEEKSRLRQVYNYDINAPILICVGELNKNKNQAAAINAMKKVIEEYPTAKLLLAGNGPSENVLKSLVLELNLKNNIEFLGYTLELDKYLGISDIAISLSFREGLPFNIMEAMLCNRPVIASNNRGHRELVENNKTGVLLASLETNEISQKIKSLIKDEQKQEQLVKNAADFIMQFTDAAVEKELETIYEL